MPGKGKQEGRARDTVQWERADQTYKTTWVSLSALQKQKNKYNKRGGVTFYPPVLVSILLSIWMGHMSFEKDTL